MRNADLRTIAVKYGVDSPTSVRVGKPRLTKAERQLVAKLKRRYADILATVTSARHELLRAASGGDTRALVGELVAGGHELTAMSILLNNEQIAVVLALSAEE